MRIERGPVTEQVKDKRLVLSDPFGILPRLVELLSELLLNPFHLCLQLLIVGEVAEQLSGGCDRNAVAIQVREHAPGFAAECLRLDAVFD